MVQISLVLSLVLVVALAIPYKPDDFRNSFNRTGILQKEDHTNCPRNILSCMSYTNDWCCSPKYGKMVLSLTWDRKLRPQESFTIHGLWPMSCDLKNTPSKGCDPKRVEANVSEIVRRMDNKTFKYMQTYWLSNYISAAEFWKHEWSKHGTCYTPLEPKCYLEAGFKEGQDVLDYFRLTTGLAKKFDVFAALKSQNIIPKSNINGKPTPRYKVLDMKGAIEKKLGARPTIHCFPEDRFEVRFYFRVKGKHEFIAIEPPKKGESDKEKCESVPYLKKFSI